MGGDGQDLIGQLRELRRWRGLSLEQVARLLGVSYTTVQHWEHGKAVPSAASRARLERLLRESVAGAAAVAGEARYKELPREPRPFIGRSRELGELLGIWPGCQLLTLTGAGGIGKSRLAVELLRRSESRMLAVADLGAVSDPALALNAIAMALDLRPRRGVAELDAIVAALRGLEGVLFLDTCERVAESLRAVLRAVLARTRGVQVLATSQVPLGVPGETTWRVPGLALPGDVAVAAPGAAGGSDAVWFFVARAREHTPGFAAEGSVLAEVVEICRRLDGIPLALGLAAGWMASVSPSVMLEHWEMRAQMLRDPGAGSERHRTLTAAIEWSAALLTARDRDLVALVSVFAGPVTAADIAAVAPGLPEAELLAGIRRLVEVSWLEFSPVPAPGYYRMLDPLRAWGLGQLASSGQAEAARRRHARHLLGLCRQGEASHFRADQGDWPRRLEAAAANIQAALAWCATADPELGADLAACLLTWWRRSGRLVEGAHWSATFRQSAAPDLPRARAACTGALLATDLGAYRKSERLAAGALPVLEAHGDALWAGRALTARGLAAKYQGKAQEALKYLENVLAYQRQRGDLHEIAATLNDLGSIPYDQGDFAGAERYCRLSLDVKRELGDRREIALSMANLGCVLTQEGSFAEARRMLDDALRLAQDVAEDLLVMIVRIDLGEYRLRVQEYAEAEAAFRDALDCAIQNGVRRFEAMARCGLGCALAALGKRAEGLELLEQARRDAEEMDDKALAGQARAALAEVSGQANPLSPRETEILAIAAEGLASKQIASRLGIEPSTVQTHLHRIYEKLQVPSRTAAVTRAQKLKLLPPQ
jgi:predicted ATPase/DNA-binding CsgD family transcriptional regulator/DNA-binding XRE family transcriptional regulator